MKTEKDLLKEVDLIKELEEEDLAFISNITIYKEYEKGTHVFMQDEPIKYIYFIAYGNVKIYRTDAHGKEQIVSLLQTGDMFPHTGFFRSGAYPANAEVSKQAGLLAISIEAFEKLLLENPYIAIKLFRIMGERIIDLQNRLEEQILHTTYEKVMLLLVRLGDKYGEKITEKMLKLTTKFTHQELANMIGTSRETLNRTFTQLKKNHILDFDEDGYIIIDTNKVQNELKSS